MAYEIFDRKVNRIGSPAISISGDGRISINKIGAKILDDQAVEQVLLLWDKGARKVALRHITKKDPRSYKVIYGRKGNAANVHAKTFLEYIGYTLGGATRQIAATWNANDNTIEAEIPGECLGGSKQTRLPIQMDEVRKTTKQA